MTQFKVIDSITQKMKLKYLTVFETRWHYIYKCLTFTHIKYCKTFINFCNICKLSKREKK